MAKLYYKKICSLNPVRYKFLEISKATMEYHRYVTIFFSRKNIWKEKIKDFSEWLKTEI